VRVAGAASDAGGSDCGVAAGVRARQNGDAEGMRIGLPPRSRTM
jgi:hypothetical protein